MTCCKIKRDALIMCPFLCYYKFRMMNVDDYKNLIKIEKENIINDLEFATNIAKNGEFEPLTEYFYDLKNKIHNIYVYKLITGDNLSEKEYKLIIENYYSEYYEMDTFDYFEILFNLDKESKLPNFYHKISNKDYLITSLLKHLKNCIDNKNYVYDVAICFIQKYCNLIKKYNKEYNVNLCKTCKYTLQIIALKVYLKHKISRKK